VNTTIDHRRYPNTSDIFLVKIRKINSKSDASGSDEIKKEIESHINIIEISGIINDILRNTNDNISKKGAGDKTNLIISRLESKVTLK